MRHVAAEQGNQNWKSEKRRVRERAKENVIDFIRVVLERLKATVK